MILVFLRLLLAVSLKARYKLKVALFGVSLRERSRNEATLPTFVGRLGTYLPNQTQCFQCKVEGQTTRSR